MGLKTYKATELWLNAAKKLLGFQLRVSGAENIPDRPTMFVSNHFTRIETFLTPYALFLHTRRQVRTLGMHRLFHGLIGRYFELLGGMSTREPHRNRTIIHELMTGTDDWLIYPEGGLVKNKKMIKKGKLLLERPRRHGPPHSGAAMLALKAEIGKRRYLRACERNDAERMKYYQKRYRLRSPDDICTDGIVIVPINLTFYPLRPGRNLINRLVRRFSPNLDPRVEEELLVEGKILMSGCEIIIHFGDPIEVSDYLDRPTMYARRLVGMFSEMRGNNLALSHQARRLTGDSMRSVYGDTEVNLDHLFCRSLYALPETEVDIEEFHRSLYLAAMELAQRDDLRVHPSFRNGISSLVAGGAYWPLDSVVKMAEEAGIVRRANGKYLINQAALHHKHDFHQIRLKNTVRVIANEIEPNRRAISVIEKVVRLSPTKRRELVAKVLLESDLRRYEEEYEAWADVNIVRSRELGEPFYLRSKENRIGVVLVHGYLGCPEQIRPLADYLHERGMNVYGVRLAAHGTSPRQLPYVTWMDWMDSVRRGYATVRQHCDKVVMAGFSFGGVLALLMAARHGDAIDAVVSINAPFRLQDYRARFVPAILGFNSILSLFGLAEKHRRRPNDTGSPGINYDQHYLEAVSEIRRAVKSCRRKLDRIEAPVLVIQSENDPLVAPDGGRTLLASLQSAEKVLLEMPFDRHMIVRGPGSELVFDKVNSFIERTLNADSQTLAVDHRQSA